MGRVITLKRKKSLSCSFPEQIYRNTRYQDGWKWFLQASRSFLKPPGPRENAQNLCVIAQWYTWNISNKSWLSSLIHLKGRGSTNDLRVLMSFEKLRKTWGAILPSNRLGGAELLYDEKKLVLGRVVHICYPHEPVEKDKRIKHAQNIDFDMVLVLLYKT